MRKRFGKISLVVLVVMIFTLSGCSINNKGNPIIKDASVNFSNTVNNNKDDLMYHNDLSHFGLQLQEGEKLEWAQDPSVSNADISFTINLQEFLDAGLDLSKLNSSYFSYSKDSSSAQESLVYKYEISNEQVTYSNSEEAFEKLISVVSDQIAAVKDDGYVLNLDKGFQLHWNSDERKNKDLAFIIAADDLVGAGLDLDKLKTWKIMKSEDPGNTQLVIFKVFYLK